MKNYILILVLLFSGCAFQRNFTATAKGAKALQYGSVDDVIIKSNIKYEFLKCSKKGE